MPPRIPVRAVQIGLGFAYAAIAAAALTRMAAPHLLLLALVMLALAWLTGRTVPDFEIAPTQFWLVAGTGLLVLAAGVAGLLNGSERALTIVGIAMAYCAGNRLRAGGLAELLRR